MIYQPQHTFLAGADGKLQADIVGKAEDMQASYDAVCARIRIPSAPLGHVNRSQRGDYREYYDQQLIDGVAKVYARDLEMFDYQF